MVTKFARSLLVFAFAAGTCMPAWAASYSPGSAIQSSAVEEGVTAGFNMRLPLGPARLKTRAPEFSLALNLHRAAPTQSYSLTRDAHRLSLASIDFSDRGFERLAIAQRTALSTEGDVVSGRRLNFAPEPSTLLWGAVIIAAGIGIYLLVDDDSSSDGETMSAQ